MNEEYTWIGSQKTYIDEIHIKLLLNSIVVGQFGGNSSAGQYKNEDGCLVWMDPQLDWEFVVLLDAHNTAQSAELVVSTLKNNKDFIIQILSQKDSDIFDNLHHFLLNLFKSEEFRKDCSKVQGETACLIIFRKNNFLWWFSIGDCILHLFHSELASLGEYQQNHRSFFEWIGRQSTFNKTIPCYSAGTKELRKGANQIFLTTDGLVECPNANYYNPEEIYKLFDEYSNEMGIEYLLKDIKDKGVRDSTTIISWTIFNDNDATRPSDMK
ncbi:protein phosphatase 2C domain-containing protein [Pseudalkalibacillus salsuginis]|uniref:protein phosphatase 2C domain-containing protein n=1 Tax=Pseudalkalibacillus salsuginis TaxID=2910972 RepID=UPI001F380F7F|nr:protein phosphatase 2C domain-containing protein [Pseudalkalibacillus salsuginis]MCF6409568.1 protein phosphatase 2C domain-containing protein [Pseudalkalibacillus salsuginis]